MAIAVNNRDSSFTTNVGQTSISESYASGSGSNRYLVFFTSAQYGNPSTLTYNGDSGTNDKTEYDPAGSAGTTNFVSVGHLINPDAPAGFIKTLNGTSVASVKTFNGTAWASVKTLNGTATTGGTLTATATRSAQSSDNYYLALADYTGADQSGQPDATASATASAGSTSISYNITTVQDGCWIATCGEATGGTVAGTSNLTIFANVSTVIVAADTNGSVGAAGSKTISATFASSRAFFASESFSPV